MAHLKFDVSKLERLNDPGRFDSMRPDVMLHALALESASVLVDIGAGTGLFAEEFARRMPGVLVYAVDMEPTMIEWMRLNRPEVASGVIVPILSSEESVPLDDAIADAVTMLNLHHELAVPAETYAEAYRLLAPGGRLLVVDWAAVETPKGPPLAVRVTPDAIGEILAAAGFVDVVSHGGLEWHSLLTATRPA